MNPFTLSNKTPIEHAKFDEIRKNESFWELNKSKKSLHQSISTRHIPLGNKALTQPLSMFLIKAATFYIYKCNCPPYWIPFIKYEVQISTSSWWNSQSDHAIKCCRPQSSQKGVLFAFLFISSDESEYYAKQRNIHWTCRVQRK